MGVRVKTALELRLPQAATPARVAEAASLLAAMLASAAPRLGKDAVTMVVENRNMKAFLRTRSRSGERAVDFTTEVLEDPRKAAEHHGRAIFVAQAFGPYGQSLAGGRFYRPAQRAAFATIDEDLREEMRFVARDFSPRKAPP